MILLVISGEGLLVFMGIPEVKWHDRIVHGEGLRVFMSIPEEK